MSMVMPALQNSAEILEGLTLEGGWVVTKRIIKTKEHSGGNFSIGYEVENATTKKKAFLKAIDYSKALQSDDVPLHMQILINAYMFERNILEKCRDLKLNKVVIPLCHGQIKPPGGIYPVNYLIFDLADGDIRKYLSFSSKIDLAWKLDSIHQTAVALNQLHKHGIAHQDIKPSNILVFGGDNSKIGDMGRSVSKELPAPHDDCAVAGDLSYAPPELEYEYVSKDWGPRRVGCDLYLMGSHIVFLFIGTSMTSAIKLGLSPDHKLPQSGGTYGGTYKEVLPYLRKAFDTVLDTFVQTIEPLFVGEMASHGKELVEIVRQLCEPDIEKRGMPKKPIGKSQQYDLQRYISRFDVMAKKSVLAVRRAEE